MTRQGSVFGSISYMSPEQVNGGDVDGRADIFSAGVVLYELLSGRKPFTGESPTAVLARIMDDQPASVADLPSDLPRPLVAAVLKALEKDREKRYRHAADMGADLRMVRSALTAGDLSGAVDLAETRFTDASPGPGNDSGYHQPAGSVIVSRTATLDAPETPASPGTRPWLVSALGVAVVAVAAAVGGWYLLSGGEGAKGSLPAATAPAAAARRIVTIASQPPGARIAVDGVDTGRVTPADLEVDPARLPRVTLLLGGRVPVTAPLTSHDVQQGSLLLRLEPAAGKPAPPVAAATDKPAPPVAPAAAAPAKAAPTPAPLPPPPAPKARVVITGEYPFEVLHEGRVISAAKESHEISVPPRARLVLRNADYFLNHPVQLDGTLDAEWPAPGLGRLDLRARETCEVAIAGRNLGEPPILQVAMAAGMHTAVVACPGQPPKRQTFIVSANQTSSVTVR
jgi:hypothetical protein